MSDQEWEWGYCDWCKSCLECANDIIDCECNRSDMLPHVDSIQAKYRHWWETENEGVVVG